MSVNFFVNKRARGALAGLLSGAALAVAAQDGDVPGSQPVPVEARNVGASVTLGGTVVPFREVTLSAQLPGRVVFLAGEEGDPFDAGATLAQLDDRELVAQRQAALAALRDADVAMRNANVQYGRELVAPNRTSPGQFGGMGMPTMMDQMFTRPFGNVMGIGNPYVERSADLWQQGAQIEQARNSHIRAQAQVREINAKFRDSKSIAPFDGVITNKLVEIGDTVQPGQPMLQFADTEYLQVQVEVPARLMPGIREGLIVRSKLDVGDRAVNARVAQIFPLADPERHTVRVKFDLPTQAPAAPGMYAEVMVPDVNAPVRQVLVIPVAAIVQRGSLPMVHVATEQGQKELRIVRLGEYVDSRHVTVLSGLQPGDFIHVDAEEPASGRAWSAPAPRGSVTPPMSPRY